MPSLICWTWQEYVFGFTYSATGVDMEVAGGGNAPGAAKGRRKFPCKVTAAMLPAWVACRTQQSLFLELLATCSLMLPHATCNSMTAGM